MKMYCQLRIDSIDSIYSKISEILSIDIADYSNGWIYEIELNNLSYIDAINVFLNILDNKYEELKKLEITKNDITFWILIENNGQSNIELDPEFMKNIGNTDVSLCISFW